MSRARQRRVALRKAFQSMPKVQCYNPEKVRYTTLREARASGKAQGLREYRCGDHYHLTSKPNYQGGAAR